MDFNFTNEQQMLRDFVETQAGEQRELRGVLDRLTKAIGTGRDGK